MPIEFYYLSGSPFAWKVWLALEHKRLDYRLKLMSADKGELKIVDYLAINPRGRVPAIIHEGFTLYESSAIIEYLEEAFPDCGKRLWPDDLRLRALGRRLSAEVDAYLYPPVRRVMEQLVFRRDGQPDESILIEAKHSVDDNLAIFAQAMRGDYLLGAEPTAADYAVYPLIPLLQRFGKRHPGLGLGGNLPDNLLEWRGRIESLEFFDKTWPPHWGARQAPSVDPSA